MAKRKERKETIPVSITIGIEQDKWLRERRDFNLSRFVRESLQKEIEESKGDKI